MLIYYTRAVQKAARGPDPAPSYICVAPQAIASYKFLFIKFAN